MNKRNSLFLIVVLFFLSLHIVCAATQSSDEQESFDPIKKNGEYFVGWNKPKLALVFTGFQNGYLEPCGCAGMAEMKGGLSRRYSLLGSLRDMGWPVVAIEAGDMIGESTGKQAELKFHLTIEAMRKMGYDAIGLGKNDLGFSAEELLTETVNIPDVNSMFTSANVAPYDFDPGYIAPYKVIEANGVKIGVVSIVTSELLKQIENPNIAKADPVKRLKQLLPQIERENCDYLVLISHGKSGQVLEETQEILKSFPKNKFGIVVVSDPPAEPPLRVPKVIDGRYFIEVGEKGKFAVVLGIFEEDESVKYQSVAIDSRYVNSPVVMDLMQTYQDTLKELGPKGLGLKSYTFPKKDQLGNFVGSEKCKDCHEQAYDVWKKSKHAEAWHSLTTTANPARNNDPECVACHVVGWNPVEKYPYTSGFDIGNQEKTDNLTDVGCESCHGPGENHIKAEQGSDKAKQAKLQLAMRLPVETAQRTCISCHDGDNSPKFDFDTYWKRIEHKEE